ncbi:hypothetical protein [Neisseria montereyensis]|uniref:Regulatory protein, RpfE type n=1 Tax=Neisseria montereyensis TaxID=2973938 RepID=A0ABT2FFC5_9NEIS|nr:hypothetical protein [Neisseria montereyensis]MCS4534195.1 hypothetical protein [Neisseria montereyensis]
MNLTLALPSLNFNTESPLPDLNLPFFNKLLRFGTFQTTPAKPSAFYGKLLWNGSLLNNAKKILGIPDNKAAIFASPVWQQMGMHHMDMLSGNDIQIQQDEAEAFCNGLNIFLQDDGWFFYPLRPDLWLVTLPKKPEWQVGPILDALGQLDGTIRAEGNDNRQWLQKQTEIQMWLHNHTLNNERSVNGMPAINGIWLWQDIKGSQAGTALLGSSSPWAQFYPANIVDAPYDFNAWQDIIAEMETDVSDGLLFLDDLTTPGYTADVWAYKDILETWEQRWFEPLWHALRQGRLKTIHIMTDGEQGGCLTIKAKAGRAFWKPKKVFTGQLGV